MLLRRSLARSRVLQPRMRCLVCPCFLLLGGFEPAANRFSASSWRHSACLSTPVEISPLRRLKNPHPKTSHSAPFPSYQPGSAERPGAGKGARFLRGAADPCRRGPFCKISGEGKGARSEEHTSELQSR